MYDVIVICARCAGSPTAMLLAQKGYRVLLVDRATFPSDIMSTHIIHYPGVKRLKKWSLLESVMATNCPPNNKKSFDINGHTLAGYPPPVDDVITVAPRRKVLDKILVDAAVAAGAELREGFIVNEFLVDERRVIGIRGRTQGGTVVKEHASIVVGADGKHSRLAHTVAASVYNDQPPQAFYYYTYWSGLPADGLEVFWRHHRFVLAIPTNDDLTCLVVGWPHSQFHTFRADIEGSYLKTLEIAPRIEEYVRRGKREERFLGTADLPNFYRKAYGPGWALVGDASLTEDPLSGHGIMNAFRDAELLANAIDTGFSGRQPLDTALAEYEHRRNDASFAEYEGNWKGAQLEGWDTPEKIRLFAALRDNPEEATRYFAASAYLTSREEYFAPENIERIITA